MFVIYNIARGRRRRAPGPRKKRVKRKNRNREARRAGFRDMEEIKRKAAGGFLGVGACLREDGRHGEAARKADK